MIKVKDIIEMSQSEVGVFHQKKDGCGFRQIFKLEGEILEQEVIELKAEHDYLEVYI